MELSRRAVVAAGALSLVSSCRRSAAPAPPDPDVELRAAALLREQQLVAAYDSLMRLRPALAARLAPLAQEKAAHVSALGSAQPLTSIVRTLPQLVALERSTATAHGRAALEASRSLAPLLASLSAASACAAAVL